MGCLTDEVPPVRLAAAQGIGHLLRMAAAAAAPGSCAPPGTSGARLPCSSGAGPPGSSGAGQGRPGCDGAGAAQPPLLLLPDELVGALGAACTDAAPAVRRAVLDTVGWMVLPKAPLLMHTLKVCARVRACVCVPMCMCTHVRAHARVRACGMCLLRPDAA